MYHRGWLVEVVVRGGLPVILVISPGDQGFSGVGLSQEGEGELLCHYLGGTAFQLSQRRHFRKGFLR